VNDPAAAASSALRTALTEDDHADFVRNATANGMIEPTISVTVRVSMEIKGCFVL
jgi:hypothetical protein